MSDHITAAVPPAKAPGDIEEFRDDVSGSPFYSRDMAPTTRAERKWAMKDIAALWISMSACIPTYMLASSLISEGMNWWQAVLTIFLGNTIVLIPMVLNAHAGTKYGIPFPVYCRASFGILGANVPAMLRALVACGWFGIQTRSSPFTCPVGETCPRLGPSASTWPSSRASSSSGPSTWRSSTGASSRSASC